MPYRQILYHLVWATKSREPLITPEHEESIYGLLRARVIGLGGRVLRINGMPDQIRMAVARFVDQAKGATATRFNRADRGTSLFRQDEYGAFSCDRHCLPISLEWIDRQKEHHAQDGTIPCLERTASDGVIVAREERAAYLTGYDAWLAAMTLEQ